MPLEIEKKILNSIHNELPIGLVEQCAMHWQTWLEKTGCSNASNKIAVTNNISDAIAETLAKVWACSEVAARWCILYPDWLTEISKNNIVDNNFSYQDFNELWLKQANRLTDEASLYKALRCFRNQQMLRIIWRDISGWSNLENTISELSSLADCTINAACSYFTEEGSEFVQLNGTPFDENDQQQELIVIAMGKLGARELNLSSDIDLIFTYQSEGKTQGGNNTLECSEYFIRLGKKVIAALNNTTADGFVFRVDMRLRPFGDGGTLASSFNMLENYYQIHGREWERYAMIKARAVTGSDEAINELTTMLRPFIYRRYMDYGAYESMRELKTMIEQQIKRKGMQQNVKLGAGGIREIEFIGQVYQLIRGGRDTRYQQREILNILECIKQDKHLPEYAVDDLKLAYVFLRDTEHRLQAYRDQQTHQLPDADIDKIRLAYSMGFDSWDDFNTQLDNHRKKVHGYFEQVFSAPQAEADASSNVFSRIWNEQVSVDEISEEFSSLGFSDSNTVFKILNDLRISKVFQTQTTQGQKRINQLMPMVIGAVSQVEQADVTLQRVVEVIESVVKRSVYLSLLIENPLALSQLVKLCAQSPWVTRYISKHPLLLDDLLDPRSLYLPVTKQDLQTECQAKIKNTKQDDELIADAIRHFKQTNVLRVAAADLAQALSLMRISDYLSRIAEVVLDVTLDQAWRYMLKRYGRPVCNSFGKGCDKGFAIIAYGKLGGFELGYGSDLDMVFLHGAESDEDMTELLKGEQLSDDGLNAITPRSIVNSVFFTRLGQRIIHLLSARTAAGRLYDVDMRLRPNGASGLLVSSLKSYTKYQQDKAWVWEHQALVRARAITGDEEIIKNFRKLRKSILSQERNITELKIEVAKMRTKMRTALIKETDTLFDIKHSKGGMVDIEFIVQFGVLAWANKYPDLCDFTDNISLLHVLEKNNVLSQDEAGNLTEIYMKYRQRLHRLSLQDKRGLVDKNKYKSQQQFVIAIWQKLLPTP